MEHKEKEAVLIAGFGTTHQDSLERAIVPVEQAISRAAGERPCFRAFTSPTVRRILLRDRALAVDSPAQALEALAGGGFTRVWVQPTLLLPGWEYDRLCTQVEEGALPATVGKPLLWDEADLEALAAALEEAYPARRDRVLLLMGHGTDHAAHRVYDRLSAILARRGMMLCTIQGRLDFDAAARALLAQPCRRVHLAPLLLTAGEHTKNDMAIHLRSKLEALGFQVTCSHTGLGELATVQELYARKLRRLVEMRDDR